MAGYVYAVVTRDPITGEPTGLQADLDWNLGTAAHVASIVHGEVVAATRGPWQPVPAEVVAAEVEAFKQRRIDEELERMTRGEEGPRG